MADVTQLLNRWSSGDASAFQELAPLLYSEMKKLARKLLNSESPGHTLPTTGLVHEAYLRLVDQDRIQWKGRAHFLGAAANTMRRILVDHARRRLTAKRGAGATADSLEATDELFVELDVDIIALDRALDEFAAIDPDRARVVDLRYFAGLSIEETASLLEVSPSAINRDWAVARAWLYRRLHGAEDDKKRRTESDSTPI